MTTHSELPVDVQKFLFDKYYNYDSKKDSNWAKDLLVKYGALSDTDRRLPADVRWFLSRVATGDGFVSDSATVAQASRLLTEYSSVGPSDE